MSEASPAATQENRSLLQGVVVAVAAGRSGETTAELIRRQGAQAIVGPTVEEVDVDDDRPLRLATERLIESPPKWSVHLTGVGTRRWFDAADKWGMQQDLINTLSRAGVIARGPKSARVLRSYNLHPIWSPDGETSAEIAQWLASRINKGDVVSVQRHGEEVPQLLDSLALSGAVPIEIAPYRWRIPLDREPAKKLVQALVSEQAHVLVVTSAPQVKHLLIVASEMGCESQLRRVLRERVFIAAVGSVSASALEREGIRVDFIPQPARQGALARGLGERARQVWEKLAAAKRE